MREKYDPQQTNPLLATGDMLGDQAIQKGSSSSVNTSSPGLFTEKFWNFCHACADTNVEESVVKPALYRRKVAAAAAETVVEVYLVYLWDYCVVRG